MTRSDELSLLRADLVLRERQRRAATVEAAS